MKCREYIVSTIFIVLLIWGPIDDSLPAWLLIRLGYLVLIPMSIWFFLKWIWKKWQPDSDSEDRLLRTLVGVTAGALLVMAVLSAFAKSHLGNTQVVRSIDGYEDVGDDIVLPGPNWGKVLMLLVASGIAFWYSMSRSKK